MRSPQTALQNGRGCRTNRQAFRLCTVPAVLLSIASIANAANRNWNGGGSADKSWSNAANWSAAVGTADIITLGDLPADGAQTIELNGNRAFSDTSSGNAVTMSATGTRDYTIAGGSVAGSILDFTQPRPISMTGSRRLTFADDMVIRLTPTATNQNWTATVGDNAVLAIDSEIQLTSNSFTGLRVVKSGNGILRLGGTGYQGQTTFNAGELIITSATAMSHGVLVSGAGAKTLSLATNTEIGDGTTGWSGTGAVATIRIVESGSLNRTVNFNGRLATGTLTIGANEAGSIGNVTIGVNGSSTHATTLETIANSTIRFGNSAGVTYSGGGINGAGNVVVDSSSTVTASGTTSWVYTGSTTINSGILFANATISGTSGVTVQGTGMLGGTSIVSAPVTLKSGGAVRPGATTGTNGTLSVSSLTVENGGKFSYGLAATSDSVNVSGALTFAPGAGSAAFTLDSTAPATNGSYTIASAGSISNFVGGLDGIGTFDVTNPRGKKFLFSGTGTTINAVVSTAMGLSITPEVSGARGTVVDGGVEVANLTGLSDSERTSGNVQIDGVSPPNVPIVVALDVNATSEAQLQAVYDAFVNGAGYTIQKAGTLWTAPEVGVGGSVGGSNNAYDFLFTFSAIGADTDPSRYFNFDLDGHGLLVNRVALAEVAPVPEPATAAAAMSAFGALMLRRRRR